MERMEGEVAMPGSPSMAIQVQGLIMHPNQPRQATAQCRKHDRDQGRHVPTENSPKLTSAGDCAV